jgi:hypothetical protein
MYSVHQPIISRYARENADNFGRVLQFVILTAHKPLFNLPADVEQARAGGEDALGVLFGWKFSAYNEAWLSRERAYTYCEHVIGDATLTAREQTIALVSCVASLPGFDLAKAGFVTQLAYGLGGCLDGHNRKLYGYSLNSFRNLKQRKTPKSRAKLVSSYVDAIAKCGTAGELWDKWCAHVANRHPAAYRDAYHVSAVHCEALGLPEA